MNIYKWIIYCIIYLQKNTTINKKNIKTLINKKNHASKLYRASK